MPSRKQLYIMGHLPECDVAATLAAMYGAPAVVCELDHVYGAWNEAESRQAGSPQFFIYDTPGRERFAVTRVRARVPLSIEHRMAA
ncbi:MAG: hypothetical protein LPH21_07405 [Shewanella sp.]|nr:hypothetical protein [Shewanella sp.]